MTIPGGGELLLIAAVIMLLFGAKKLPEFARSLGKAKTEFKKGLDEEPEVVDEDSKVKDSKKA